MSANTMQRMNGIDPMFIYSETPSTPMEVAYACVFDPSTAPAGYSFESVRQVLAERLPGLTAFRRRLLAVPFGLDHPRWVDDPDFDLDNHLRRTALPAPHGQEELLALVAEIMGRPLCPEQPPWEMHMIEGLADGQVALVAKVHHAVIDGVAGAQLLAQLLDLSAEGRPVTETCAPWTPPALPSAARLISDALPSLVTAPLRSLRAVREVGRTAVRLARSALNGESAPLSIPLFAPDILQQPVLSEREVAFTRLALDDITTVRQRFGLTINDVVLAICSGALRSNLAAHDQRVDGSLVAIVPVSVRQPQGGEALGNQLSAMFVSLGSDQATPLGRLAAIVESCVAVKAQERAVGYGPLASAVTEAMPPALAGPVVRAGIGAGILRRLRAGNLMVSNVPGPDFALYFAGMRMESVYPLGPVVDGVALNITVQSYERSLFVGVNAGATAVHDLDGLARAMVDELAALVEASTLAGSGAMAQAVTRTPARRTRPPSPTTTAARVPLAAMRTAHADPSRPIRRERVAAPKDQSWD
jgi:WS/DGAT/MGAT family acyltransferase